MPPAMNTTWRLTPTAKRAIAIFCVISLLYITLTSRSSSWWDSDGGSKTGLKVEHKYTEEVDAPLNVDIKAWGLMGQRVRQLSKWANYLVSHPREDRMPFVKALSAQFPFLKGTENHIYNPWLFDNDQSSLAATSFVICAGSANYQLAAHLITSLRNVHKSTTPIEIAYSGEADLKPEHREYLRNLATGISFIDLLQRFPYAHNDLVGSGWAMKPFSLIASKHPRAILVDADAIFLTAPDDLFSTNPGLNKTGTLFFHDRAAGGGDDERQLFIKAQLEAAGIPPSHYLEKESLFYTGEAWYEADSGVVCLDKSRPEVLMGLIFATWMNTKEVREQVSYRVFYGDKETFWIAMELSSVEYFFQPWYAGSMGTIKADTPANLDLMTNKVEICGTHMLHLDHAGTTPFWINGGIYEHKENPEGGYAQMTHYWVGETSDIRLTKPQWYWINGNTGCLNEKGVKAIDAQIRSNVEKIIAEAKHVDESIRKSSS